MSVQELQVTEDEINHPSHYGGGGNTYEAIKVIDAWDLDFSLGNCVKYICRAGRKAGHTTVADLRKARWYLSHKIDMLDPGADQSVAADIITSQQIRIGKLEERNSKLEELCLGHGIDPDSPLATVPVDDGAS